MGGTLLSQAPEKSFSKIWKSKTTMGQKNLRGKKQCFLLYTTAKMVYTYYMNVTKEELRPIIGYEGYYEVNNLGDVYSCERRIRVKGNHLERTYKRKKLGQYLTHDGYLYVCLCKSSVSKNLTVHRLVARAFIPNPLNKPEVNHKNFNTQDNDINNLEWVTGLENRQHSTKNNRTKKGHRLTKATVLEIREKYKDSSSPKLAKEYGVDHTTILSIVNRK